jgi:hypothetical protein
MLIQLATDYDMHMALPKGIPTLRHMVWKTESRTDNVWCSEGLTSSVTSCDVNSNWNFVHTDHYSIVTEIDLPQTRTSTEPSRNYRETDWDSFRAHLKAQLEEAHIPRVANSAEDIDSIATTLTVSLQSAIKLHVPINKPCPHSKRWWNSDLKKMKQKLNQLRRQAERYRALPTHVSHLDFKEAEKAYGEAITAAKRQHWAEYLENAASDDIWMINRYIKNPVGDGCSSCIPTLEVRDERGFTRTVNTNTEKAEALAKTFFPPKPAESSVPNNHDYPPPLPPPPPISIDQVRRHVLRLSPYKATGPDEIPNIALQKTLDIIEDHLLCLFRAILKLKIYYKGWSEFTTVVLRKPGKPSYNIPKAYRPIALLCTMGKVLTAIVAEELARLLEAEARAPLTRESLWQSGRAQDHRRDLSSREQNQGSLA